MTILHSITGLSARIFALPGREPFMLAADLAEAYGTSVKALNQAVSRNPDRFPEDFMFSLTEAETEALRSQNVTANTISTMVRYAPLVFTHAGALALSGVLKTPVAAEVSVVIHRAFAALEKRALAETRFLLAKLRKDAALERRITVVAVMGAREGLPFRAIWLDGTYSKEKLARELHACLARGLIETLPPGTPALPADLFGQEG